MKKHIPLASRKMIATTGGVGAIVESSQGAVLVEPFDQWRYFTEPDRPFDSEENEVLDNRLLQRLRFHFPKLKKLVRVPTTPENRGGPGDPKLTAAAHHFPKWFFCPVCERFDSLDHWRNNWKMTLERFKISNPLDSFYQPKCFHCYNEAKTSPGKKMHWVGLEQVRFVMTSPDGDLRDIPWERWPTAQKNTREEDSDGGHIRLDWENLCCEKQDLRYLRSKDFSDLSGVRIKCANPNCPTRGRENPLAGLFGLRLGKEESKRFKPILRSSNSVYYALTINSLFLPAPRASVSAADRETIAKMASKGKPKEDVLDLFEERYGREALEDLLAELSGGGFPVFIPEIEHRRREHVFLIGNPNFENDDLALEDKTTPDLQALGIGLLLQVKRLKMTTVQTGYTRQEPLDKDIFMRGTGNNSAVRVRYTSEKGPNTEHLLAAEGYGEGIFFNLEKARLDAWLDQNLTETEVFKNRLDLLSERVRTVKHFPPDKFVDARHLARFVLVHTLAHLLIKEVEFLCGYPAASISERLFVDAGEMQGVLIYTSSGSEGSYGGLLTQAAGNNFLRLLQSALHRARECAADPICSHSDGQGIAEVNFAACQSCALLPETSCEEFNGLLDRRCMVDEDFGYFTDTNGR